MRIQNQPQNNSKDVDSVTPVAAFLLVVSEVVVGGVLIYGEGHTCESMKHTGLWVVALILFWSLLTALLLITGMITITFAVGLLGTFNNSNPEPKTGGGVNANRIGVTIVNADENI